MAAHRESRAREQRLNRVAFNSCGRKIHVEANGGANPQFSVALVDDRDRCLPVSETVGYRFQSEE